MKSSAFSTQSDGHDCDFIEQKSNEDGTLIYIIDTVIMLVTNALTHVIRSLLLIFFDVAPECDGR